MNPGENKIDIDPDYARNNNAVRKVIKKEQEESILNPEQLSDIIKEDFDKELSKRQKQLEEIEEKITKAQKLLHLVRYVLITSYYNKKSLEFSNSNDETTNKVYDRQNRIHPAIKKLLGKNASLDVFSCLGKRKAVLKSCDNSEPSTSQAGPSKKIKKEKQDQPKTTPLDNNQNCLKNRRKTQHRLIIGNISKYAPTLEDDNMTHKWMVYVRGDKNKPDISHIVDKVRFYLHPSYKPHDVVEISEYPFHLARRGWGEFPVRVQIVFKCKLNKPIEIVHDLRLDKTCSGRQLLGNETLVDVYLHENITSPKSTPTSKTKPNCDLEPLTVDHDALHQELNIKEEHAESFDYLEKINLSDSDSFDFSFTPLELSTDIASQEHDYCQEEVIEELVENTLDIKQEPNSPRCSNIDLNNFWFDHSYCASFSESESYTSLVQVKNENVSNEEVSGVDNKLRYGLDESYSMDVEEKTDKKLIPALVKPFPISLSQPIKILLPINNKTILTNGHLVATTPTTKWLTTAPVTYRTKYTIRLPANKFKNMGEILPYLMKRVPLWSSRMKEGDFKRIFPFMASSKEEFESWNIGKRINAEWSRAKTIRRTLEANAFPESKKWNTKAYFMYARSHMYSPVVSFGLFMKPSRELYLLNSCFASSFQQFKKASNTSSSTVSGDDEVNVEDLEADFDQSNSRSHLIDISDPSLKSHCAFIKETALDNGILLQPTEIIEGVVINGAERMILEAVKCFAEGLIRRGYHHMVTSGHFKPGVTEIQSADIQMAMDERAELQSIKDFRRQRFERSLFS